MPTLRDIAAAIHVLLAGGDRTEAWRFVATVLLTGAGGALAGLAPLALKGMIDAATSAAPVGSEAASSNTWAYAAAYLLALCSVRLLSEYRGSLASASEQRLCARLRRHFFGHVLGLPLKFHLERRSGEQVHGLQQAIAGCQIMLSSLVNSALPILVELLTLTVVLHSLGLPALVAAFAGTALAYLAVLNRKTSLRERARTVCEANIEVHGMLVDGLLNIETIKCFGAEEATRHRFQRATSMLEDSWAGLQRSRLRMGLAVTATFALSMAVSLAILVEAALDGTLSAGGFVMANVCMLQVVRPLEMLGAAARDLSQAIEFMRPLMDVLAEPLEARQACAGLPVRRAEGTGEVFAKPTVPSGPPWRDMTAPRISFRNVRFAYDDGKPVLKGFNLDIAAGHTFALVGASGSGKSSLARLLLRLYEPQAGCVMLNGVPTSSMRTDELRSSIGVVAQDTVLFHDTISFNIGIGKPNATRNEIERAARLAHVHEFIASLPAGYDTLVGERGLRLSGGERQRIAIARAVLKSPSVYLFDEATSMLDSLTETAILGSLREVSAGRTTITIAHRLSTVQHADQIVVLDGGKVAERGTHVELLATDGIYARMWTAQMSGLQAHPAPAAP